MVIKDLNEKFEKNNLPDSIESADTLNEKIEDWLHNLENKSNSYVSSEEYSIDKELIQSEILANTRELQHEVSNNIKNSSDVMKNTTDTIQDERRVVNSNQKNITSFSQAIQHNIEQSSEQKESVIGRQSSYAQVELFTQSLSQESWFFARMVKILS